MDGGTTDEGHVILGVVWGGTGGRKVVGRGETRSGQTHWKQSIDLGARAHAGQLVVQHKSQGDPDLLLLPIFINAHHYPSSTTPTPTTITPTHHHHQSIHALSPIIGLTTSLCGGTVGMPSKLCSMVGTSSNTSAWNQHWGFE